MENTIFIYTGQHSIFSSHYLFTHSHVHTPSCVLTYLPYTYSTDMYCVTPSTLLCGPAKYFGKLESAIHYILQHYVDDPEVTHQHVPLRVSVQKVEDVEPHHLKPDAFYECGTVPVDVDPINATVLQVMFLVRTHMNKTGKPQETDTYANMDRIEIRFSSAASGDSHSSSNHTCTIWRALPGDPSEQSEAGGCLGSIDWEDLPADYFKD